jgi:hypothetical protein
VHFWHVAGVIEVSVKYPALHDATHTFVSETKRFEPGQLVHSILLDAASNIQFKQLSGHLLHFWSVEFL